MHCCTLLVALTLSMGYGDLPMRSEGIFATPMFLMGQPVWVTRVSRRQLRLKIEQTESAPVKTIETEVAVLV